MKIDIDWSGEGLHFLGHDDKTAPFSIDGNRQKGPGPMGMLLYAAGGCSAIDMLSMLKTMRQEVKSLKIEVNADRPEGKEGRPWKNINIHFILEGDLDPTKVQRAMDLSLEKYCSVSLNLRPTSTVLATFEIKNKL